MEQNIDIHRSIDRLMRQDYGRLLSSLIGQLRDLQLAEDCLAEAIESALEHWQRNGLPRSPQGWLVQTARRRAIDKFRRSQNFQSKEKEIAYLMALEAEEDLMEGPNFPDERLRLIFTCCHPALAKEASVALTLRSLCGLKTEELARAFIVSVSTMSQRLVRAKSKIKKANIPYEVPELDALAERLRAVLDVIYLVFNAGHAQQGLDASQGIDLRNEAIRLGRILLDLLPDEVEAQGLLALMLLHQSRQAARFDEAGEMVGLEDQDRSVWDQDLINEGIGLVQDALAHQRPGPFQLQAAVAALHAEAASFEVTDWAEIEALYRLQENLQPNPVVTLNRLAAQSYRVGPNEALEELESLRTTLGKYQPFYALEADLAARAGARERALGAYARAIELNESEAEKSFLAQRRTRILD